MDRVGPTLAGGMDVLIGTVEDVKCIVVDVVAFEDVGDEFQD